MRQEALQNAIAGLKIDCCGIQNVKRMSNKRRNAGFTLLPALASAKEKAQRTQCVNNNHQIGIATHMYVADNKDKMPYPNWNPPWVAGWLYDPVNNGVPDLIAAPYTTNPQLAYQGGQLWQYINNIAVYRCPLDRTNTITWRQRTNKLSTYIQNGAICGYGALGPKSYNQSDFRQDSFVMWEPNDPGNGYGYNDGASYPDPTVDGGLGTRHGKVGGIVMVVQRYKQKRTLVHSGHRQWSLN